jgi:hypothetical protein
MYFADSSTASNLQIYKNLMDLYMTGKHDEEIKHLFENAILTTYKLLNYQIRESAVDNKIYDLVIALSDANRDWTRNYFSTIDPDSIGIEQFQTLQNILSSLVAIPSL